MLKHAKHMYPYNTPNTKEAYFYRMIFEKHFPQESARMTVPGGPSIACSTAAAIAWDKAWADNLDPSGRAALGVHDAAYHPDAPAAQSNHEKGISANNSFSSNPILGNVLKPQGVY
jgi:asparagine synthase (glutamine-hydrolysing)